MRSSFRLLAALFLAIAGCSVLGAAGVAAAPKEIAYSCKLDICLIDPDNPANVVNLTDNEGASIEEKPVRSPDGKRLAFVSRFTRSTLRARRRVTTTPWSTSASPTSPT